MIVKNRYTNEVIGEFNVSLRANLRGADLEEANLEEANLEEANLGGADLRGADLGGANLGKANLERANLKEAYLEEAYLEEAYLGGANLEGANLEGADLREAYLGGANLGGANLGGAKGIISIQFSGYSIYIQKEKTKIGCRYLTNEKWLNMTDKEALELGANRKHIEFYRQQIKLGMELLKMENNE